MRIVYFLIYNLLFLPLLLVVARVVALFNHKVRSGLEGRRRSLEFLKRWTVNSGDGQPRVLFHCASMGEFEQIRPVLRALRETQPGLVHVVSFFSPSGFENVEEDRFLDLKIYLPLDTVGRIAKFLNLLQPRLLVISKHDVWPNLVWSLASRKIPAMLVNGTMPADSYALKPGLRGFYRSVYSRLRFIAPASQRDLEGFAKIVGNLVPMEVLGDTRFDQVLIRSQETARKHLLNAEALGQKKVIVAGSIWPSDEQHLFPAFARLLREHPDLVLILVPHEPEPDHVQNIANFFEGEGHSSFRFSERNNGAGFARHRILIVDQIGVLANLYGYGHIAYVGGSFGPGVHNVMEPAAYGLPVLFGPKILNSPEAQALLERQAGFRVESWQDCYGHFSSLLKNEKLRQEMGRRARQLVEENRGATEKIVRKILEYL